MNYQCLKLTPAIPLIFLVLGLTATSNLPAYESVHLNKVDRNHTNRKHKKLHSTNRFRPQGNRSKRHHNSEDLYSTNRHYSKHGRRHRHGHKHTYHYNHGGYKRGYRHNNHWPRSGFTYYSNDGYWNNDRPDFIIRYRGHD